MNKFVFLNPHTIWFKKNLNCFLNGTKSLSKYDYLFDYFLSKDKVYVIIEDPFDNKFFNGVLTFFNSQKIYFWLWVLLNKFKISKFVIINDFNKLKENDFLFGFHYGNFTYEKIPSSIKLSIRNLASKIKSCPAKKIFHLNHYAYNAKFGGEIIKMTKPDFLVAENNLKNNSMFYNEFFHNKANFFCLPFVFNKKFKKIKKFEHRKNKVFAFGTITHEIEDESFIKFFKTKDLQPERIMIFRNRKKLDGIVDCHINNSYRKNNWKFKVKRRNLFRYFLSDFYKLYRLLINIIEKKDNIKNDLGYYKTDIVSQLNSCKIFMCPEEICDLPGIGFVEGMACGSAFIGKSGKMYDDLGLIHNKNYIAYDGTLKDFENKVQFYLNNPKKLKLIADNGYKHAIENFNSEKVTQNFINYLNIKT